MQALCLEGSSLNLQERTDPRAVSGRAILRMRLAGVCNTDLEIARGYMGFQGVLGHEGVIRPPLVYALAYPLAVFNFPVVLVLVGVHCDAYAIGQLGFRLAWRALGRAVLTEPLPKICHSLFLGLGRRRAFLSKSRSHQSGRHTEARAALSIDAVASSNPGRPSPRRRGPWAGADGTPQKR